jgi:hypothetical protein
MRYHELAVVLVVSLLAPRLVGVIVMGPFLVVVVFVVTPQLPDCSPSPISSRPEPVYVLGMSDPYAAPSARRETVARSIAAKLRWHNNAY